MGWTSRTGPLGVLAAGLLASAATFPAGAAEVTTERMLNADSEPQNWLMIHRTYDSHRYSPLDQINRDNVADLRVMFTTAVGGLAGPGFSFGVAGHQATPLAEDGFLYFPDGYGAVYKVDTTSGRKGMISWIMDPGVDHAEVWIASNRGVTFAGNNVISVTSNGQVNWTNKDTGELVNSVVPDDPVATGYSLTTPPILIGDKLIVGGSGGDRGARAHIDALNAETGEQIWRTYSIPAPGEPGSETWKDTNNAWQHGGGSFWQTGSYDPEQNLTIWGTGQPVPMFDPEYRPGDNLFTNSAVAFDVDTGAIKWYFQYTPNDPFDYDEIGVHQLIDLEINGEPRKVVGHFGRNGFYYLLDRTNGQFIHAVQYVDQLNWTAGIDPKTGKPVEYDPNADVQTYNVVIRRDQPPGMHCPNLQGGVNFFPTSYSDRTRLTYGAGIEGCSETVPDPSKDQAPEWNGGNSTAPDRLTGSITAINPATAEKVAQHLFDYPAYTGVMSTAGGIVFTAISDGTIYALNDETLEVLWEFNTGTTMAAVPMTYMVGDKQYIAVLVGGGSLPKFGLAKSPEMADIQDMSALYVFAL